MRRSIILTAMAASVGITAWCGSALAQARVEFYVGPSAPYDAYSDYPGDSEYRYGPRPYGYHYGPTYRRDLRRPEDYRAGSNRWWKEMDQQGRSGGN
jgi:hypothetical protein